MTVVSAILLQKVYLYQTTNLFDEPPKGHITDFFWGILAAVIFHVQFKPLSTWKLKDTTYSTTG
jgi:hypothetical protein